MAATGLPTLLDIVKRQGTDAEVGLVEETVKAIPEVLLGFARPIKGVNFKTRVRTALPSVGFRNLNEGVVASKGKVENRLVEAFIMNPRWNCDKMAADEAEDGPEMFIAEEGVAMSTAGFQTIGSQFYYGLATDPNKGFPGLIAAVDAAMVQDATGTTVNGASSLWGVKWGRQAVGWVWGLGAELKLSDVRIGDAFDANGNPFTAYIQELAGRPGLQVLNKWACGRIKNLTAQATHTLTDAMVYTFLSKFPPYAQPDMLLTTQRQIEFLRASRTATNATGSPAPTPTEVAGIPLYATQSLTDTEAIS